MLSQEAIKYLKENNYSFEEIEWIKLGLENSSKWEVISKQEMQDFVKVELFSKYAVSV